MSKVYLKITTRVIVDTDLTDVDEIMENIDIEPIGDLWNVAVLESEVTNVEVEDSK